MNINTPYANVIMIIIALTAIILFYRKCVVDGLLGFGLTHILFTMISYFIMPIYKIVAINTSFGFSSDVYMVLFIYVPAFICYFLIYIIRKYLFNLIITIKSYKLSLTLVLLLNYALILGDTFRSYWQIEGMEFSFQNTFYIVAFLTFIFTIIYFAKVRDKAREVEMLNVALNEKIAELKKIKHDYGSEISGLYDRGYGLIIVKEIIDKCNGKIYVDSDKDWTQFKLEIPNAAR